MLSGESEKLIISQESSSGKFINKNERTSFFSRSVSLGVCVLVYVCVRMLISNLKHTIRLVLSI